MVCAFYIHINQTGLAACSVYLDSGSTAFRAVCSILNQFSIFCTNDSYVIGAQVITIIPKGTRISIDVFEFAIHEIDD